MGVIVNEIDLTDSRAEHVQPSGYDPLRVTEPPTRRAAAELRAALKEKAEADALAAHMMRLQLADVATDLSLLRMQADAKELTGKRLDQALGSAARRLRGIAAGLAALALVTVALVAGPTAGRAEAMEAPQPDPVAQAVRVVLGAQPTLVNVRAAVYTAVSPGWFCGSVRSARGFLGRYCSAVPTFTIPVSIDPRTFPVGRSFAQVVDDGAEVAVSNVTFDARRPSRFQRGTFIDQGRGDLFVSAPLTMYSAPLGRYIAQQYSPVQVQVAGRHGWVTVATLTTTRYGVASGVVHLGGGVRVFRVARPAGATVWSTAGTTHRMNLLTEPVDVV